jgi:molybdate transport system substrate-binding protein
VRELTGKKITVISGGSAEPGLDFVAAAFQKETGHAVRIIYNTGAQMIQRMKAGEVFDVVITTSPLQDFRAIGKVEEGGISLGRVGVGMMVRPGAPVPDISSVEAFKRAVLEAESILCTTSTSGVTTERILRKLGIYEQVEARITRCPTGPEVMERVVRGSGREISFLPFTEILVHQKNGLVLVGPLPDEVQHYLELIAAPTTDGAHPQVAREFVRYCGGPGRALLAAHGVN